MDERGESVGMKRRAFLLGYYGFNNLGDELLCEHYRLVLRDALPDWERWILSADPRNHSDDSGEKWVDRWALHRLVWTTRSGDLWVVGGGTLLQNLTSQRSLLYYLGLLLMARKRGAKIVFLGQGIGPLKGRFAKWAVRKALQTAAAVEVRDRESYRSIEKFSLDRVRRGVDPLWATDFERQPLRGDELLLILRAEDAARVRPLIERLAEHWPNPRLAVFQPWDKARLHPVVGSPVQIITRSEELPHLFDGVGVVVASRMHGVLLSAVLGIPAVGLSRDPKVSACCELLDLPCVSPETESGQLSDVLRQIVEGEKHLAILKRVQELKAETSLSREWAIQTLRGLDKIDLHYNG